MGLRINTNTTAMTAQRSLSQVNKKQENTFAQLASGQRINKASDDAAGLAISEKLKAEIVGSRQATRNAGDGISIIQVAEGGLSEVSNILVRLRELSVQAASDTIGDQERQFTDLEYQQLTQEIDRISQSTQFNGSKLLTGEGDVKDFQIGTGNDSFADRISYKPEDTNATLGALGLEGSGVAGKTDAQENLAKIDEAINSVNGNRANLGALQNRLQSTISNLDVKVENLSASNSRIRDTDFASATSELASQQIIQNASTAVLAQANTSQQGALRLIG